MLNNLSRRFLCPQLSFIELPSFDFLFFGYSLIQLICEQRVVLVKTKRLIGALEEQFLQNIIGWNDRRRSWDCLVVRIKRLQMHQVIYSEVSVNLTVVDHSEAQRLLRDRSRVDFFFHRAP